MNARPGGAMAIARLDAGGRLLSADARLAELNAAAGGAEGAPLALPAIAALARLSRRLGIVVARPAMIADGEDEVELWVRADPLPDATHVEVSGWRDAADADQEAGDFAAAEAHFVWETDATMTLSTFSLPSPEGAPVVGQLMTRAFDFGDETGLARILTAAANRADFSEQPATLRSDGRSVRLSGRARVNPDGHFAGFGGTGRFDATAAPAPSAEDDQFAERLDRALRLPLQRIVAHADSIGAQSDGPVRSEYVEYAQDIASAARHLMALVDDLVDLSAIERPDFHVEIETIDLADVARRAAGLLGVRASNADVRIDRSGVAGELAARGEFRRTLQILVNLIGNGVRYSPRGEAVSLSAVRSGDNVSVTVTDRGRGVAADDQSRIFEKFGRVDPSEPGGNGLGLYIARRLARAMGGDVTVESEAGQGARFTLTLPAAA